MHTSEYIYLSVFPFRNESQYSSSFFPAGAVFLAKFTLQLYPHQIYLLLGLNFKSCNWVTDTILNGNMKRSLSLTDETERGARWGHKELMDTEHNGF